MNNKKGMWCRKSYLKEKALIINNANGNCNNRVIWEEKRIEIEREDVDKEVDKVDISTNLMQGIFRAVSLL